MFKPGDILCGKYRLTKQFNKGGFSSVWLAEDLQANTDFALKVYDSVEDMNEFRKSFNMVVNLNHSNIFTPNTYYVHLGVPFLVMTYCAKGSCTSRIGKMSEEELWRFAHDVASGLAYLHVTKGIVHQDIKPGNILIDDDGKFMITDFDISTRQRHTVRMTAEQVEEMQRFNHLSGTTDYMGPERWPDKDYTPPIKPMQASDIWSLGATLFELMEGEVPYGQTGGAMQKKAHQPPTFTTKYSKELKKLVMICLSEKAWDRPTAHQIAVCAEHHKAPDPHPKTWKKYAATVIPTVAVATASAIYLLSQKPVTEKEGIRYPGDSILIVQVQKATDMVRLQHDNPDRWNNGAASYISNLKDAILLYTSTDTLVVSDDSIRTKGWNLWKPAQEIIDEEYEVMGKMEQECENSGAQSAAKEFRSLRNEIEQYISRNNTTKKYNNL